MSYHRLNNLAELLNLDLSAKIGLKILSVDLMDIECNSSLPSKINSECVYKGECWKKCLIYELKCSIIESNYIDNIQRIFKEVTDGHFSYLLRLHKNGKI